MEPAEWTEIGVHVRQDDPELLDEDGSRLLAKFDSVWKSRRNNLIEQETAANMRHMQLYRLVNLRLDWVSDPHGVSDSVSSTQSEPAIRENSQSILSFLGAKDRMEGIAKTMEELGGGRTPGEAHSYDDLTTVKSNAIGRALRVPLGMA